MAASNPGRCSCTVRWGSGQRAEGHAALSERRGVCGTLSPGRRCGPWTKRLRRQRLLTPAVCTDEGVDWRCLQRCSASNYNIDTMPMHVCQQYRCAVITENRVTITLLYSVCDCWATEWLHRLNVYPVSHWHFPDHMYVLNDAPPPHPLLSLCTTKGSAPNVFLFLLLLFLPSFISNTFLSPMMY